ncbi:MAG: DUF4406 domain-containing protein [Bacteroidota bacterium]
MKKTVYISLPVRGQIEHSRQRAEFIENFYEKLGFNVYNPHKIVDKLREYYKREPDNSEIMSVLFGTLGKSDMMALDENWAASWGCNMEIIYALHHDVDIVRALSDKRIDFKSKFVNEIMKTYKDKNILTPELAPAFSMYDS